MADPVTNNYSITLPTVGGDSGTWGTILNAGVMTVIDGALGANFSTVITSADVTLTTTQFQNAIFVVSGTLTGNRNLIVPYSTNAIGTTACGGRFVVVNNGAGAFNLSVKTATTGTSAVVPQGFAAALYSDGVNVKYASDGLPGYALASNGNPNNVLTGTAASVNTNASLAFDYTNSLLYVCTGGSTWAQPSVTPTRGFEVVNMSFTTSVAANLLTVTAVAANTNTTPTLANPIIIPFRSTTAAAGAITYVNATGSLSINTNAVGATLGAANTTPFRLWICAFNNAGAATLALVNCSSTNGIFSLNETGVANTTGISGSATATSTFYTPNGVSLTGSAFRIVGFISYESGLATAGTYNNGPTITQIFSLGVKKPGDIVQSATAFTTTVATTTNASFAALTNGLSKSVTPTSAANLVRYRIVGTISLAANAVNQGFIQAARGASLIGNPIEVNTAVNPQIVPGAVEVIDAPATTSSTTYSYQGKTSAGTLNFPAANTGVSIFLDEIMG